MLPVIRLAASDARNKTTEAISSTSPMPGHRGAADPGIVHLRTVLDECIERRRDIGRRHRIDADAARAPFGRQRLGQMVHRGLRGIVVTLFLRLVDDEPRHRADIDDGARSRRQHVPAEGAAAPEGAVEVDVDHIEPVFVGDLFGRRLAAGDAGIVDENVDLAVTRHQFIRGLGDAAGIRDVQDRRPRRR